LLSWRKGQKAPRSFQSLEVLHRIEQRYQLPKGYFATKLPHQGRAASGHDLEEYSRAQRRRLAWHLPDDFNARTCEEQDEILAWVHKVIITGSTDYRAFQAAASKQRYGIRFRTLQGKRRGRSRPYDEETDDVVVEADRSVMEAPESLEREMADLLRFKTSTLTTFGFQRSGVWNGETASQKAEHLGLMFGALAASPDSAVRGRGVP
jgi:hypothetical protein